MPRIKLRLLAAVLSLGLNSAAHAASSNVNSLSASGAIVGSQLFYCPIGASTDYKCTAAQIAAYNYSLMSGDCTASGTGAITCTGGTHLTGVSLATGVTGNLPVGNLNGGVSASNSTFWRGDGTWATPSGSGAVSSVSSGDSNLTITPTTGAVVATLTNVPVNKMNGGTGASSSTFWRGDGTWQTPSGSGTVTGISTTCPTAGPISPVAGVVTLNSAITTNPQTGTTYTVLATDCGSIITLNNASAVAVTLPQAGTSGFLAGFYVSGFVNLGNGVVTITPATSTINGSASITLAKGQSIGVVSDGTNYSATVGAGATYPAGSNTQVQINSSGNFGAESQSGTGGFVASAAATGTQVNGNVAGWDGNHNVVDTGVPVAGLGGGSAFLGAQAGTTRFWPLDPPGSPFASTGSVVQGTGYTYCSPFSVPIKFTIAGVYAIEQTAGTTTAHAFIYTDAYDSTNHLHYPSGAPVASDNNNPANTGATVHFTFASNLQLSPSTIYWKCTQQGDTTAKWYVVSPSATIPYYGAMVGAATALDATVFQNVNTLYYSSGTFGTPPNTSSSTGWTETPTTYSAVESVNIYSIP